MSKTQGDFLTRPLFFLNKFPYSGSLVAEGHHIRRFSACQEALSNIDKHSQAKQVFINLIKKDHLVLFSVEDGGMGFDVNEKMFITSDQGPLGLHVMRERIVQLGGELNIDSRSGAGTHILAELPL